MVNIIDQSGKTNYGISTLLVDTIAELEPIKNDFAAGTAALVTENDTVRIFILSNNKKWVEF